MTRLILGMLALLTTLALDRTAEAGWTFNGTANDDNYAVGAYYHTGSATWYTAVCNVNSGTLTNVDSYPMTGQGVVNGLAGKDVIRIITQNAPQNVCGVTLKGLLYGGYPMRVNGGDDDDTLYGGDGVDYLYGENDDANCSSSSSGGADFVDGSYGNDILHGCGGDDRVIDSGATTGDSLYGDKGADCLSISAPTGAYSVFSCGNNTNDFYATTPYTPSGLPTDCPGGSTTSC